MSVLKSAVFILALASVSEAAETASFLKIGVGGRALGMGGAYTALADDVNALYWNPAGLSRLEKREAGASHAELFAGAQHDFLAYAHPTPTGTIAAGMTYLSHGKIEGRDTLGRPTGGYAASDAAVSLGYGRKLGQVDLGLVVKYVRSHIGSTEAQTFAVDAGVKKELGAVMLGATLRNLGPGLKYEARRNDLPLQLALGAGYKIKGGHAVAAEFTNGPRGSGSDVALGGEYQALKDIYLRAGYTTQTAIADGSGFAAARGLTLGMGLRNARWSLDYAVLPMGELGSSHRFSLASRF